MSADSLPWALPAPSSGPGVWDSFYHGKAPQTRDGLSLLSLSCTKYLCSLGIMCQGFEIPQKMEARTGPRLSCPFRPPGGLLGQLTVAPGPRPPPVRSVVSQRLGAQCPLQWCWGLFSGPSLPPIQQREKQSLLRGRKAPSSPGRKTHPCTCASLQPDPFLQRPQDPGHPGTAQPCQASAPTPGWKGS